MRYGSSLRWAAKSSMNCQTSSIVSQCFVSGLVGMPQAASAARNSLCVSNGVARDFAAAVGDDVEAALGDDARVELLERAGRGVAGVGERLLAGLDDGAVHALELGGRHVDFAADFEHARDRDISCCSWSVSGIARIVRTFWVTSSPRWPSPRVAASTSWPRS